MITPRFQIDQTDSDVIFTIHAPYASISDADIYADTDIFCFYASPYYLRVYLPGHIEETDASKGSYDADNGVFKICVQKVRSGEYFPDLDLITSLLTPSKKHDVNKPKIEVVGDDGPCNTEDGNDTDDDNEWCLEQCPYDEPSEEFLLLAPKYGFANQSCGIFLNFTTEFANVIDVPDPDKTPLKERARLRLEHENSVFSEDHYLADWAQVEEVEAILNYRTSWKDCHEVSFSENDLCVMKDLPKKEFLLDSKEEHLVLFSLVDILFAFSYNIRTTFGENTVESAWTVNKLSATLNWLQSFSSLKEAITTAVRRSLCFPLYRHWSLAMKVVDDVKDIIRLGKRQILKSLLEIYSLFNSSEPRYILNQLYIRDYIIWIQQVPDNRIRALSTALNEVVVQKSDLELDLEELEYAAEIVQQDELSTSSTSAPSKNAHQQSIENQLVKSVTKLRLQENCDESSSSLVSSSEDSDSSYDSESSSSSDLDSDDLSEDESTNQ